VTGKKLLRGKNKKVRATQYAEGYQNFNEGEAA
jgi:hypothetical protein